MGEEKRRGAETVSAWWDGLCGEAPWVCDRQGASRLWEVISERWEGGRGEERGELR